jgi:hypothetical protein
MPDRRFTMNMAWSRWLVGVWAVMAALWLVTATLMLIHAWPEPLPGDHSEFYSNAGEHLASGRRIKAQCSLQADPATRRHILNFLLLALLPPAFLLLMIWAGLRLAGCRFLPSERVPKRSTQTPTSSRGDVAPSRG